METDLRTWFDGVPPVTKFLTFGKLLLTVVGTYGGLGGQLVLTWFHFYTKFQIWRPLTAGLFGGGLSFMYLFSLVFFYRFCRNLEEGAYQGKRAELVWTIGLMWVMLTIASFVFEILIFGRGLELAIIYLWSQLNKDQIVSFFFGIRLKAMYFPWALLGLDVLTAAPFTMTLLGIAVGHAIFFLEYLYPEAAGVSLVPKPPQFLRNWVREPQGANIRGFGGPVAQGQRATAASHSWGSGNTLGAN